MKEFFTSMDGSQQFYWYIAIGASVIFIIQSIMTFIGADSDTGVDADFDGDLDASDSPFQLFSLRNLINFLLGFGWAGASLYGAIENKVVLGIISLLVGIVFIAVFFFLMRLLMKLSEDNSFKIEDMLNYLDGHPLVLPSRYSDKDAVYTKVFILSNWTFEQQYRKIQEDYPETWRAFCRRVNHIYNFDVNREHDLKPVPTQAGLELVPVSDDNLPF